jgi:hypothetical protein
MSHAQMTTGRSGDTGRLEMRWVPVTDTRGRTRMEARWIAVDRSVAAHHAA